MKLPKKYQGITPGNWIRDGRLIYALTPYTGGGKMASKLPDGVNRFQCYVDASNGGDGAPIEEQEENAAIIADSPRLAAAVVELREVLKVWHKGNEVAPIPCAECGEDSTRKITFLYENARNNPASSGYRGDDISWCSDAEEYACDEHKEQVRWNPPDNMKWCSEFDGKRYPHMIVKRKTITGERLKALMEKTAAALASTSEWQA